MERWNENGWRARHAWLCFAAVYGLSMAVAFNLYVFSVKWPSVLDISSPQAAFFVTICGLLIAFSVTLAFAKVSSLGAFSRVFRLNRPPTPFGIWGLLFGLGIALAAMYLIRHGYTPDTVLSRSFRSAGSGVSVLLSVAGLVSPFFEEPMMRGFLYPAFRGSYRAVTSTMIVIAMGLLLHPDALSKPGVYTLLIISLNLALCLLRENSISLWDCIICHLAYNGTLALTDIWRMVGQ